jgi:hypothetical protein
MLDQVWVRNLSICNVEVAEYVDEQVTDHGCIKVTVSTPERTRTMEGANLALEQLTQAQIRAIMRSEQFQGLLKDDPLDISEMPLLKQILQELINEVTPPKGRRNVRLRYNQPKEVEHQPEELVISGAINQHRLLDQLKEHHKNNDWKAFYKVAEKVLRVKSSNPIVRTILTEENAPINEEEEVTKSIAEYFKEVYAITEEGKEEDDLDQLMELVAQDMEIAPS